MLYLALLSLISSVSADIVHEYYGPPDNYVEMENIIATSIWALGMCSCVGLVCNHKKKTPIKVEPCEHDDFYETKNYYRIQLKDKASLTKMKKDMKEIRRVIRSLEKDLQEETLQKLNHEIQEKPEEISDEIKYMFGKGPIRFKTNGKYYHGVDPHNNYKWDTEDKSVGCFFHYTNKARILPNLKWDTHEKDDYCLNCVYDTDKNKNKKKVFTYKCNGHTV
jgi:hypothetical protein